jgi:RimJ/RimL family protein N-acetyltransferase
MTTQQQIKTFLETNRLRYLPLLKFLHYYSDDLNCFYSEHDGEIGMLLSHPISLIAWDQSIYPEVDHILMPVATGRTAARQLIEHSLSLIDTQRPNLFKFCDTATRNTFSRVLPLRLVRIMISFTTSDFEASPAAWEQVVVSGRPDDSGVYLYLQNRYTLEELERYFADGALSFTIYEGGQAVCSCLAYRNFDDVWEIGALHTLENARRKGYARQVVSAALARVLADGHIPRYVVEGHNTASLRLAESLGLQPCLTFEHYINHHLPPEDYS